MHLTAAAYSAPAMFGTLVSAAAVCAYSLLLGQGVLRLCGARRWSSLAPAVGVSVLMLGAFPALGVSSGCPPAPHAYPPARRVPSLESSA